MLARWPWVAQPPARLADFTGCLKPLPSVRILFWQSGRSFFPPSLLGQSLVARGNAAVIPPERTR